MKNDAFVITAITLVLITWITFTRGQNEFDIGCGGYTMRYPTKMLVVDDPTAVPLFHDFMHARIETWQNKKLVDSVYIDTLSDGLKKQHLLRFGLCNQPTALVYTLLNGVGEPLSSRMTIVDPTEQCRGEGQEPNCFCETACSDSSEDTNNDGLIYPHDPDCMASFYEPVKIDTAGHQLCSIAKSNGEVTKRSQSDDKNPTCYEDYNTHIIDVDQSGISAFSDDDSLHIPDSNIRVWRLATSWILDATAIHSLKWHLKTYDTLQEFSYTTQSHTTENIYKYLDEKGNIELEIVHYLPIKPVSTHIMVAIDTYSDNDYYTPDDRDIFSINDPKICLSQEIQINGQIPLTQTPLTLVDVEMVIVDKSVQMWLVRVSVPTTVEFSFPYVSAYFQDGQFEPMTLELLKTAPHPLVPNTLIRTFAIYVCCEGVVTSQLPLTRIRAPFVEGGVDRTVDVDVSNARRTEFYALPKKDEATPEMGAAELIEVTNTMTLLTDPPRVTRTILETSLKIVVVPNVDAEWPFPIEIEIPIVAPPVVVNPNPLGLPEPFVARMEPPDGVYDVTCDGKLRLEFKNPPVMYPDTVWSLDASYADVDFEAGADFIEGMVYEVSVGRIDDILLSAVDDDDNGKKHTAKIAHTDFQYVRDGCMVTVDDVVNPVKRIQASVEDCLVSNDTRVVRMWYSPNVVSRLEIVDASRTSYASARDTYEPLTTCVKYAEFENVKTGLYWLEFVLWNGCTINDATVKRETPAYKLVNVLKSDPPIRTSLGVDNFVVVSPDHGRHLNRIGEGIYEAQCGVVDTNNVPIAKISSNGNGNGNGQISFFNSEIWNIETGTMHATANGENMAFHFGKYTVVHTLSSPAMDVNCKYDAGSVVILPSPINADIFSINLAKMPSGYGASDGIITITFPKDLLRPYGNVMFMISDCMQLAENGAADCVLHVNPFDNTVTNVPHVISATLNILIGGGECVLSKQFDEMSLGLPIRILSVATEDTHVPHSSIGTAPKFSSPSSPKTTSLLAVNWKSTNPNRCIGENDASISFWIVQTKNSEHLEIGETREAIVLEEDDSFWLPANADELSAMVVVMSEETDITSLVSIDYTDHSLFISKMAPGTYTVQLLTIEASPLTYVIHEKLFYTSNLNMVYTHFDSETCDMQITASPFNEVPAVTPDLLSVFDRDNYYHQATHSLIKLPLNKQITVNVPRLLAGGEHEWRFCNEPIIVECPFMPTVPSPSPPTPPQQGRKLLAIQEPVNPLSVECLAAKNPTNAFSDDGTLQVVASGGTPPYMCVWSDVSYQITTACNRTLMGIGIYRAVLYDYTLAAQQCEISLLPIGDDGGTFAIESVDVGDTVGCYPNTLLPIDVVATFRANQSVPVDMTLQSRMSAGVWLLSPEEESPILACDDPRMHSVSIIHLSESSRKVQFEFNFLITQANIGSLGAVTNFTVTLCYMGQYIQVWNSVVTVVDLNIPVMPPTLTNVAPQQVCGFDHNQVLVSNAHIDVSFTAPFRPPLTVYTLSQAVTTFTFTDESDLSLQLPLPILPLTAIWVMDGHRCGAAGGVERVTTAVSVCGTCDVEDTSCLGCDGAAFSGHVVDGCGVCNGQSTCLLDCIVSGNDWQKALDEVDYCVMNGRVVVGSMAPLIVGAVVVDGTMESANGRISVQYLYFENVTFMTEILYASALTTDAVYLASGIATLTLSTITDRIVVIPTFFQPPGGGLGQSIVLDMCIITNTVLEIAPPTDLASETGDINVNIMSETVETLEVVFTAKLSPDTVLWLTHTTIKLLIMKDPYDLLPEITRPCYPYCDTPENIPAPDPFDTLPDSPAVHRIDTHIVLGAPRDGSSIDLIQFPAQTQENYRAFVVGLCLVLDKYPFVGAAGADEQYVIRQSQRRTLCGETATTNALFLAFMETTFGTNATFGFAAVTQNGNGSSGSDNGEANLPQEMTMTFVVLYIAAISGFVFFAYTRFVKI